MMKNINLENLATWLSAWRRAEWDKKAAGQILEREFPDLLRKDDTSAVATGDLTGSFVNTGGGLVISYQEGGPGRFDQLAASPNAKQGFINMPVFFPTGPVSISVVGEGLAIPVQSIGNTSSQLTAEKEAAIVAMTNEALRFREGVEGIIIELNHGLALAVDTRVSAILEAGAGATFSAVSEAEIVNDLKKLMDSVIRTGYEIPFWWLSPQMMNYLKVVRVGANGPLMFPDLPESLLGYPTLVTAGASDKLSLVDPGGCVFARGTAEIRRSDSILLEMNSAPAMDSITPASPTAKIVSAFQAESTGILAIRTFGLSVVRTSSVACLDVSEVWSLGTEVES